MNAKKIFKSALALLVAFTLLPFNALAAFDFDINGSDKNDGYYGVISKQDWDNAPGISESEIVLNNDAGDHRQVIHIMKADISNSYVDVIPTYSEMNTSKYQTGTMLDQANWIDENMEGEVIGVMNCCLSWYTNYPAERVGEPLGFMMMDGEIMFDPGNCGYDYGNVGFPTCVVINKDTNADGEARPDDIPKLEMVQIRTSTDLDGWEDTVIPISSGYIVKDGVNQYSASHTGGEPRSVVGITADGEVVMMENDGRQSPFSAGMNMYELAEVMIGAGCVWAANCDGGGSSTFVSQRPGEELKVNNSPSDGGLRSSTSGICFISTAPADGQFARANITTSDTYYTPNSEIQFDAVGTDLVGTPAEIPESVTWQLTDDAMGSISNTGLFTSNGKVGSVTAQLAYEGKVVGDATINIVIPEIAFKQDTIVIGYGDSMILPVDVTTNEGRNTVTYKSGDIVYTLSDAALGTIDGDKFTACDESAGLTSGTITAVICGQTDKAISADIRFGKASEIAYDFEDGQFPVDTSKTGNIGGDDAADTGEYIYGWHINDTRANGHFSYRYYAKKNYTPVGYDIPTQVYLVDRSNGMVRNGNYAMGIDIDWTYVTASCHGQMDIHLPESLDLTDATRVGFWMYIPAELVTDSMQIRAGFHTTAGGSTAVTNNITDFVGKTSGVKNGGWFYFSWEVLDTYKTFDYFQINSHYTAGAGNYNYYQDVTYYVDDITVDYSDATIDRENPYFTSMTIADEYTNGEEISGQTITSNTITLMAQAYENTTKTNATGLNRNSVKLYVDGVLSDADIAVSAGGTISISDLYLNDGVHTLVMEISDNQGNVGNIVRKLVVNTDKSDVRLEVPAPDVDLLPTGSIYWLNLIADNLSDVNSVTTTINLDYVNDWELEGMEVAYGFTAEYYINNHNDAVITFTRTGTEMADTSVLAKLPVRIWMAKGWMDDSGIRKDYISDDPGKQDKYYILKPHAMWYSDGTRDYRLVVSAEAGVVTYVDGSTKTFSANETVIQTEMNRYYTNANRQGKWSFHICAAGTAQDKDATCYEAGYTGRVFCTGCDCGTVENLGTECDNHNGCGSVIEWGTTIPATGHDWKVVNGKLTCQNDGELFNGEYTDGKTYIDGVVIADGWNNDNTTYYKDGVKLTGSHVIDKKVYTFDDKGVYLPNYTYEGFIESEEGLMYFYTNTNYEEKYTYLNNTAYYFVDGIAREGEYAINGEMCLFEKGEYISCSTATIMDAGWEGEKVTYIIYSDGRMILGGEGDTYKYTSRAQLPWVAYKTKIKSILVGKNITSINQFALADIYYANSITFEKDSKLKYIGAGAFLSIYNITEIIFPDSLETIVQNAFKMCKNLETVYLPQDISYIHKLAFVNNSNTVMEKIHLNVAKDTYGESYANQYNIPHTVRDYVEKPVASGICGDSATWELFSSGKIVISGSGAMYDYKDQYSTPWAEYLKQIKEIVIGKDITVVGNYAFGFAHNVEKVTFEEESKLEKIGAVAFYYMLYVTEVEIPDSVTHIGNLAFAYCSRLTSVYVPQDVTLIYPKTFNKSSNVVLNVAEGSYAEIYAKTNGYAYKTRDYIDRPVASGSCGDSATWSYYVSGKMVISGSGAMYDYKDQYSTPWAEYHKQIKEIVIGKDITVVGNYAFGFAHNVEKVTFEEGSKLEKIGAVAFYYMLYVTEVEIPDSVTHIGNLAFAYCSHLTSVYVPQDVTLIYPKTFNKSSNVVLNVAEGSYAETYAKTNGYAHTTRDYIDRPIASGICGDSATWSYYASGKMVISGNGAMYGYKDQYSTPWAEYHKQIKEIVIGKDITVVGNYAFGFAHNVKKVTFEEGSKLEKIGAVAFYYMLYVTEVEIPDSVTYIGNLAFGYCKKLTNVTLPDNNNLFVHANAFNKSGYVLEN